MGEPVLVKAGKGNYRYNPLWDEDGKVYMVHGYAGSRSGIKSLLGICELNADATKAITQSRIIFDGHDEHPTAEGPNSINATVITISLLLPEVLLPDGSWCFVLKRIRTLRRKVVLSQGKTNVNGPHQGAWVGHYYR